MDNEQYNQIEVIRGRQYRYDPDVDTWYRVQDKEHVVSKWAWIVCVIFMAAVCYYVEYVQ